MALKKTPLQKKYVEKKSNPTNHLIDKSIENQIDSKKITKTSDDEDNNPNLVSMIDEPTWKVILFDLIKKNNFNPWDINIITLADAYMGRIQSLKEFDFHVPANAVLCASILLRIKSDIFKINFEEDNEEAEEHIESDSSMFDLFDDSFPIDDSLLNNSENTIIVPHLQAPKRITKRKVTLTELVNAINDVLHRTRQPRKQKIDFNEQIDFTDYFNSEEGETIEENVDVLYNLIKSSVDSEGLTNFSTILESNEPEEKVSKFFPLLYLMNENKLNLWQDDFFGEIFIILIENQKIIKNQ